MTPTDALVRNEPGLARIIAVIEGIGSLPTIPLAAQHAMRLARDEQSSMRQIAEVIAQDQALAAKVLRLVNSAYYGLRQSVGTLPLALTILGVREIVSLVLGIAVVSAFPGSSGDELFNREALWRASAQCACAAKKLAHGIGLGRLAGEAFLGGLVRDIGLIVLDQYVHDEFMDALRAAREQGLEPLEAEARRLGTTHAGVGAWLAERWAFPEPLVEAIAFHHRPSESSWQSPLTALVYLAERLLTLRADALEPKRAAAVLETDETWARLMASGPPVRPPSVPAALVEAICREIEAAPIFSR